MSGGVSFDPEIEIFYRYPSQFTTSRDVSPTRYTSTTRAELSLSSPSASTKSSLLGIFSPPSDNGHVYLNPSSSPSQSMHESANRTGRYDQKSFSPQFDTSVKSRGISRATSSTSTQIAHSTPGREQSEDHLEYYDFTGIHTALASNLEFLDYDISLSPENGNSIAETEAVSPYLDKPATRDHSKEVGIQYPGLPVIIWIQVAIEYITISNVLNGMYDFLMRPSPDKSLDAETPERQFYIKAARDKRIREGRDRDMYIKWIDWMPQNRRVISLSKGPECRKNTWMIIFEDDREYRPIGLRTRR
ncbi:hypothetical protein C0995_007154 [Termitomyces sp. Mi166|nr:hypothetical protein C0995_007154 [Termitomyces sp. Mi166\